MSRTIHRDFKRATQGFTVHREPKRSPRRRRTEAAIIRAELDYDRPAVRAALKS